MSNSGLISIIIPTFNRVKLLEETLDSICSQYYENWECIVIDDHSTDNTIEVVKGYQSKDSRIIFFQNTHKKGAPGARNTGIKKANGEFIFFFDSDNLMKPNTLQELIIGFENSLVDVCVCHAQVVDDSLNSVGTFKWNCYGNIEEQLISGSTYVDYNIAMIRKSAIDKLGFTDEDCPAYQEWDTHLRLSQFCNYTTLDQQLIIYRKGSKDTISSNVVQSTRGFLYVLKKHKVRFSNYPFHFKKQGLNLLKTALQTEDKAYIHEIKTELKLLIPGFQHHIISERMKFFLWKIQDKLKKHIRG
jgi:glycosyltransferase involved in cell wall biosynthesis